MKKKILLVGIILSIFSSALTGCKVFNKNEDNTNKNGNSPSQNSYEIYNNPKKSYSIMETTDTISYKNDDTIVILEEDGDLYQIKNELNKMITKEDISEFTSVIKIENGKIVLKMTGAKAYGLKKNVIEHTITAIKYPVSLYVNPGIDAGAEMLVGFYVMDSESNIYRVSFSIAYFDGYKIVKLKEINSSALTKYVVKNKSTVMEMPSIEGSISPSKFKTFFNKSGASCGLKGAVNANRESVKCGYLDTRNYVVYVEKGEAYFAKPTITCDNGKCTVDKKEYEKWGLTDFKNVKSVSMDVNPNYSGIVYIATKDNILYYYIQLNNEEYSLIRVNTSLKFVEFVKNAVIDDTDDVKKYTTQTVIKLSDGEYYTIDYNKDLKSISLNKYQGDVTVVGNDKNYVGYYGVELKSKADGEKYFNHIYLREDGTFLLDLSNGIAYTPSVGYYRINNGTITLTEKVRYGSDACFYKDMLSIYEVTIKDDNTLILHLDNKNLEFTKNTGTPENESNLKYYVIDPKDGEEVPGDDAHIDCTNK